MWNFKETRTEKFVAQFVRWEICHWTLLWKRIPLWYNCSVFRKGSDEGPSISRLIISRTSRFDRTSFLLLNPYSRSLLFSLLVLSFIETPWYFSKNWTIHRRQNSSLLINSFPLLWHNISIHLVLFSPLAFWLQVDLVQPSAPQCAVSWQSVDYWRKCQVTKYFSRSTKIFWILERFLDCKLFDFYKSYLWLYELSQDLKLFFRSDKLFKRDLSERRRFYMVFRICKIILDCPFSAFVVQMFNVDNYFHNYEYSYVSCW